MRVLFLSLFLCFAGTTRADGNIVDVAEGNGSFTTLKAVLDVAGLTETLKGEGPYTVFAPTDEAFSKLPPELTQYLIENPAVLKSILLYHVVSGEFDSQKLVKKHSLTSVFGAPLSISAKGSVGINNAEVIIKDVTASNGIIHAIDSVILPGKRSSKFLDQRAFETNAYLGLWNDFARTPNNFQDNTPSSRGVEYSACFDSTALYTLKNAEKIDLVNTCYRRGSDGSTKVEDIKGRANVKGTRKLKVAFGGFILRGIQRIFTKGGADYWIYGVGAKNEEGLYSWALVSGPEKDYIFVLTRDKRVTKQQRNEILSLATLEGLPVDKLIFDEDR